VISMDKSARNDGWTLRATDTSPFGRKIRIALQMLGFDDRVTRVPASPVDPDDPLRIDNPLAKMPCLILADGEALFDSPVILEFLDMESAGRLVPTAAGARLAALREQALADGLTDAAVLMGSERMFHPEEHVSPRWIGHQRGKVERALAAFEKAPPALDPVQIGAISLACALGYLDWRKPVDWRADFPGLVDWLDRFRAVVAAYDATRHAD
jgi:glutathione S-transferase